MFSLRRARPLEQLEPVRSVDTPEQRLPLRWLVIGIYAGEAGLAAADAGGSVAAITISLAVALALHKMTS